MPALGMDFLTSGPSTASSMVGGTIEAMRDIYIPIFNNRTNDREWRQHILLYKRKHALPFRLGL